MLLSFLLLCFFFMAQFLQPPDTILDNILTGHNADENVFIIYDRNEILVGGLLEEILDVGIDADRPVVHPSADL